MSRKRILVIAGSDSSGGAGLEADQKVIAAHGCYAMTATTALTAQNTTKVFDVHITPSQFVQKQIDACIDDIGVDVVKTGMLASAETIEVVADALQRHRIELSVVDPVMVSTTGAQLLPENAVRVLRERLLPVITLLTPNMPEALLILENAHGQSRKPQTVQDIVRIAGDIQKLGPKYVLLKGGHLPLTKERLVPEGAAEKHVILNVLCGDGEAMLLETDYLESKSTHGTGCSLASAIASNLASGLSMVAAVKAAIRYVEAGIKYSNELGKGNGPINHFHSNYRLPFAPGCFVDYLLERDDVQTPWIAHTDNEFVRGLANGTLPVDNFKRYLIQDYLFLIHFSRAHALAAYKAKAFIDIERSASIVTYFQEEAKMHLKYCRELGISKDEIERSRESVACTAYTRFILDVGQSEDWFALQVALLPCLLGYAAVAQRWNNDPSMVREGNRYVAWFDQYTGEEYSSAVKSGTDLIEKHAPNQSVSRIEELVKIFIQSTRMEVGFWEMGMQLRT